MNKTAVVHKESVVYPLANIQSKKVTYIITDNDFSDILSYVDHHGMTGLQLFIGIVFAIKPTLGLLFLST